MLVSEKCETDWTICGEATAQQIGVVFDALIRNFSNATSCCGALYRRRSEEIKLHEISTTDLSP
jgi:hypothetical protein